MLFASTDASTDISIYRNDRGRGSRIPPYIAIYIYVYIIPLLPNLVVVLD